MYCMLYLLAIIVILSWLAEDKMIQEAITGRAIINEEDVETQPEKAPASILNENVCLTI